MGQAAAKLSKGLMDVYMYLGQYRDGLRIGQKALAYFRSNKLYADAGQILNNIGNIYHRMDKNRNALAYYQKAREIFKKKGGVPLAIIDYNRANIFANMNQIRAAEKLYLQAADIYRKAGLHIAECQAQYSIAYLYFLEDRYTEAIRSFENLFNKFSTLGDFKSSAVTQLDMIEINLQLNQYSSVIMQADQIMPILNDLGMKYEIGKTNYFSAIARIMLEDYKSASRFLDKAKIIMKSEGNHLWLGMIEIARSKIYIKQKKYTLAVKSAESAAAYYKLSGDERRGNDADIAIIEAKLYSGQINQAKKLAGKINCNRLVNYQNYNLESIFGSYYYGINDYRTALPRYKKAVAIIEKMITGIYPDEIRYFFVVDKYACYKMMIDCMIQLGDIKKSFIASLKALEIINYRIPNKVLKKANIPPELLIIQNELRAGLKKMIKSPDGSRRQSNTPEQNHQMEQKLWYNERKIRAYLYPEPNAIVKTALDDSAYNNFLKSDEILVNLFMAEKWVGAFVTNGHKTDFIKYNISPEKLNEVLRKYHFISESETIGSGSWTNSTELANEYLTDMYSILITPIEKYLTRNKLLISAEEQLSQIPFIALRDKNGYYLKDKFEIRLIINPEDLRLRNGPGKININQKAAIFAASSEKLPLIEIEAEKIARLIPRAVLYNKENASLENIKMELNRPNSFVHIAAHASRDSENPLFSKILLNNGPFFPFDLFKTGINAKLITLSGCQTAAPGLYYGNSFSLAKAFYQAGAGNVLASLWTVSDRLSMMFMACFYKSIAEKKDIYNSYITAVDEVKKITDNPAYWSAFILIGI
ncbi:MAG: CHAT domain-containing tetratricopeptide repeat protein [Candidatus Zixiibacteriota bacterium]